MSYQCLVLDIDNTLLTSDHQISPATEAALIAFQEAGHTLVLASGRPYEGMIGLAKQLHMDQHESYVIAYNGATITHLADGKRVYQKGLDLADQKQIIPFLQSHDVAVLTYGDGEVIIDHENAYTPTESRLTGLPDRYDPAFFENLDEPMIKIMGVADPAQILPLEESLGGHFGENTTAVTSQPFFLEFFHREVSKGDALEQLAERINIPVEQMVAVGDANNDISMVERAGLGVAMGNASEGLKAVADVFTGSNDEDGIVAVVEQYFK